MKVLENDNTTKSSEPDPAADVLAAADRQLSQEQPKDPVTAASGEVPIASVSSGPPAFLKQAVSQLVGKGLILSKLNGWSSPSIPKLLTEEEWQQAVSESTVAVVQKRWPDIANDATPEFALIVLTVPWLLDNLIPMLFRRPKKKEADTTDGKGSRDTRSNGDGKNNAHAEALGPVPTGFPHRPDA